MISNQVPWLGPDGRTINGPWFIFLQNLDALLGSVSTTGGSIPPPASVTDPVAEALLATIPGLLYEGAAIESVIAKLNSLHTLIVTRSDPPQSTRAQPESAITVGASPFQFQAPFDGTVLVSGGIVTEIDLTRNNTYNTGLLGGGAVPVSRLDIVTVTYTTVPSMAFFPR